MLFEVLEDITTDKTGRILDDIEEEIDFSPYVAQRFLSMIHPSLDCLLNRTINRGLDVLDKKQAYLMLSAIVPRIEKVPFRYFKRKKVPYTKEDEEAISFIGSKLDISRKLVIYYVEQFGMDLAKIKKILGL